MYEDAVVIGGLGVVGTATRRMLGIWSCYDYNGGNISEAELTGLHYIFLCLPTPTVGGVCDVSLIRRYVERLGSNHTYIVRSTVAPGTARGLATEFGVPVVSCPEFLTEALAQVECLAPDLLVLGADSDAVAMDVWTRFFCKVHAGRVVFTDTVTAEFIKYAVNVFYATKVLYANAMYDVAEKLGIDYDTVKGALYARKWIGGNHLTVPWKGVRGLNGKCLPKDLAAFATFSGHPLFEFLSELNERWAGKG